MSEGFVLNILIVEDDFSFALDLQMLVEELGYQVAGVVDSGEKALDFINRNTPDAILMDIDLKGELTGFDVAERIKDQEIPTLFITSHQSSEDYERAKAIGMVGFLVKPLNDITLLSAIDACLKSSAALKPDVSKSTDFDTRLLKGSLLIKKGKVYHKVKLNEIIHISSDLEYATIFTNDEKFTFRESLKNLTNLLESSRFIKVHQSHILNVEYLKSIDTEDSMAVMTNKALVPISRRKRKELEELWHSYG